MKGCLESVDWTTGLEYCNGLNCYKQPFSWYDSFPESSYSLSHFINLLHALFRHPASKSWRSKVTDPQDFKGMTPKQDMEQVSEVSK